MQICAILGIACMVVQAAAQNYGPLPPRPQFPPGASLVQGPPPRQNFRQRGSARAVQEPIEPVQIPLEQPTAVQRLRRPQVARARAQFVQPPVYDQQRNTIVEDVAPIQYKPKIALPNPVPQFQPSQPIQQIPQQTQPPKLLTPRPVVEDEVNEASEEEAPEGPVTTPSSTTAFTASVRPSFPQQPSPGILQASPLPVAYQRPQFPVQGNTLRPQPIGFPETASLQARQLIRPQVRPPLEQPQIPVARPLAPQVLKPKEDQIGESEPQYFRQQIRPQKKQEPFPRQQIIEQEQLRGREPVRQIVRPQQPIRQQQQELPIQRPIQREPHIKASTHPREKKPVAQTIRKFHEEHEDGSITWGYENDDGSFKEETIGIDCVTRGKYGYYDPDGVKREYTYQTGIPCDRQAQEAEEAESQHEGYIDYTNNKYVLPNGDEIDLEAMVKNRARKPVQRYRN